MLPDGNSLKASQVETDLDLTRIHLKSDLERNCHEVGFEFGLGFEQ